MRELGGRCSDTRQQQQPRRHRGRGAADAAVGGQTRATASRNSQRVVSAAAAGRARGSAHHMSAGISHPSRRHRWGAETLRYGPCQYHLPHLLMFATMGAPN